MVYMLAWQSEKIKVSVFFFLGYALLCLLAFDSKMCFLLVETPVHSVMA